MKIVYLNYMWDLWGISIGSTIKSLELLHGLSLQGHEIQKYWRRGDIGNQSRIETTESPQRRFLKKHLQRYLHEPGEIAKNIPSIREEIKILKDENPDLVIARVSSYNCSPVWLSKRFDIPFLIEIDSPSSYENIHFQKFFNRTRPILYGMEKQFIMSGKAAFTVSNQLQNYFIQRGIPETMLSVIPNGADAQRFRPDLDHETIKQRYQLNGSLVIGFVGSFIYWHGIENLMYIIKNILDSYKEVKFLMVGDGGPMKAGLETFIRENKYQDRALLTGFVSHDDIPTYMSAMDIALAPYPGLDFFYYSPVKIYEYMSSGIALVSTRIGQIAEVVEHGKTGLLSTPDNREEFVAHIKTLIEDEALRRAIARDAREEIMKKHTWEQRGKQLSDLCSQIVSCIE